MKERIIVSLTTWSKRIQNIPTVLDTIFAQTLPPDLVVLNLAYDEVVPDNVQKYIDEHHIEVNRVPDTKVYKKILPTLKKYPSDCIIGIDDDWLYPEGMIEDFIEMHKKYPNNPISGATFVNCQTQSYYHSGCASLTKASYFEGHLDNIDEEVIKSCPADDYVYTYFANKAGHPYIHTSKMYYVYTLKPYNEGIGYSSTFEGGGGKQTWDFLEERFGKIESNLFAGYIDDKNIANIVLNIYNQQKVLIENITGSTTYKFAKKIQMMYTKLTNFKRR